MINIESALLGGRTKEGVVQVGNTVRRPLRVNYKFTHLLLKLLEEKRFTHAPRFLGIDEEGREILSFIEGVVPHQKIEWMDDQLKKVAQMIKQFHDATAGSELAGASEVVGHNDIAPWNTVINKDTPVAFIDFDDAAPGNRADDLAYFLWTFLELGGNVPVNTQASKIKMLCGEYGWHNGPELIDALLGQQEKILATRENLAQNAQDDEARKFSASRVIQIRSEIEWVKSNRKILEEIT